MQRFAKRLVIVICGIMTTYPSAAADDARHPTIVYIDPAPYLPEGMIQLVEEPLENVTLTDLAAHLTEQYGLTVQLLEWDLQDEGLTLDVKVTLPAGIPLYQALNVALEDVNGARLAWVEVNGIFKITSEVAADDILTTKVYDVPVRADASLDPHAVIDSMQTMPFAPWLSIDGVGGDASENGGALVVRQTEFVHREVACLLEAYTRDGAVIRVSHPPHHARLFDALDQIVDIDVEQQTLEAVIAELSIQTGVPMCIRNQELADEGAVPVDVVTYHFGPQPLRQVFEHVLRNVGGAELDYQIANGMITITTAAAAGDDFEVALYDVRDLLTNAGPDDIAELVCVSTLNNWYVDGYSGEFDILATGYLEVRAEQVVHREIQAALNVLRERLVLPTPPPAIDPETADVRYYFVSQEMSDTLLAMLREDIAPETWQHDNEFDVDASGWIIPVRIPDEWGHGVEPQTWMGGQGGFFQVPPSWLGPIASNWGYQGFGQSGEPRMLHEVVLVVRQSIAVHQQIDALINELIDPLWREQSRRDHFGYQIEKAVPHPPFAGGIRSDVVGNPDWSPDDRPNLWPVMLTLPERITAIVDAANYVSDALKQPVVQGLRDVRLGDLDRVFVEAFDLHISLDERELQRVGISSDSTVTLSEGFPLHLALNQLCRDVDGEELAWFSAADIVTITSSTSVYHGLYRSLYEVKAYEIGDLSAQAGPEVPLHILQDAFVGDLGRRRDFWQAAYPVGNVLLVYQTQPLQRQLAAFLDALRVEARVVRVSEPIENERLYAALDQPVSIDVVDAPLESVIANLAEQLDIRIDFRMSELADMGITPDDEVSGRLIDVPLRTAFDVLFENVQGATLTCVIADGVMWITSTDAAQDEMSIVVYNVSDILQAMPTNHGMPDYRSMIDLLYEHTSQESGIGDVTTCEIAPFPGGRLVVFGPRDAHEAITHLIEELRDHLSPLASEESDREQIETRYYELPADTAVDLEVWLPLWIAPGTWASEELHEGVGRIRRVPVFDLSEAPRPSGFFAVDETTNETEPAEHTAGAVQTIAEPPVKRARLIITQTSAVHHQIAALLEELRTGIAANSPRFSSECADQGVLSNVFER